VQAGQEVNITKRRREKLITICSKTKVTLIVGGSDRKEKAGGRKVEQRGQYQGSYILIKDRG